MQCLSGLRRWLIRKICVDEDLVALLTEGRGGAGDFVLRYLNTSSGTGRFRRQQCGVKKAGKVFQRRRAGTAWWMRLIARLTRYGVEADAGRLFAEGDFRGRTLGEVTVRLEYMRARRCWGGDFDGYY